MINWGFIGCGSVAEKKSGPAFSKIEGSRVDAIMRRRSEAAKDYALRHNIAKWSNDADDIINSEEINAVYIATPPGSHAQYAIKAMEAGKAVYIEKPMGASYKDCIEIAQVAEKTGQPCFVAYYRRTLPYFLRVKQLLDEGEIGTPVSVHINFIIPPYATDLKKDTLTWRVDKEIAGAGYFYDLASHQFDFLDFALGKIVDAKGTSANQKKLYDVEDTVDATWVHVLGVKGSGHWEFAADVSERTDEIEITGTKGSIKFSTFQFSPICLKTDQVTRWYTERNPENIQYYLIESIVKYLINKEHYPVSDYKTAMRTNRIMDEVLNTIG